MALPQARPPDLSRSVTALVRELASNLEAFSHLRASRILIVAGEARRGSWASIRGLGAARGSSKMPPARPLIELKGRRMLYLITLRPRFFRAASPRKRLETIIHELFHISRRFDGTLHKGRRHSVLGERFGARLAPLVDEALAHLSLEAKRALSHHGLVQARQWLERPPVRLPEGGRGRARYTERQLFRGPLEMVTREAEALDVAAPRDRALGIRSR